MSKSNYLTIANDLVKLIHEEKLSENDKMPSEAQLSIKYGVSRIVASKAFAELLKVGAVYSVPKKGYFVSENFSGMVKPITFVYGIDRIETIMTDLVVPKIFKEKNITPLPQTGIRKYFKGDELIIISHFYALDKLNISANKSFLDMVTKEGSKVSSIIISRFEDFAAFDNKRNLVNTNIVYVDQKLPIVERYVVNDSFYISIKQEFSL